MVSKKKSPLKWYVYMLRCADGSLYTGIATDVARRLNEHNGSKKAARYTRSRQPVVLVYTEAAESRSAALVREAALKKLSRREKLIIASSSRQK